MERLREHVSQQNNNTGRHNRTIQVRTVNNTGWHNRTTQIGISEQVTHCILITVTVHTDYNHSYITYWLQLHYILITITITYWLQLHYIIITITYWLQLQCILVTIYSCITHWLGLHLQLRRFLAFRIVASAKCERTRWTSTRRTKVSALSLTHRSRTNPVKSTTTSGQPDRTTLDHVVFVDDEWVAGHWMDTQNERACRRKAF